MAAALLALLTQQSPNLQTRKGLLITGLQNDFVSPEGKLPVRTASSLLDKVQELVPAFRAYGDVIWVRSHFQASREVNRAEAVSDHVIAETIANVDDKQADEGADDREESPVPPKKARISSEATDRPMTAEALFERIGTGRPGLTELQDEDDELFLTKTGKREPCCIPGSFGADYATQVKDLVDPAKDLEVTKTFYSAFDSTSLLLTLRSRLITELYVCGCITNLSVFATAIDAARYGIKVTLIEDCLGYRRKDRHELAMKQLREIMGADVTISTEVIERLRNPPGSSGEDQDHESYEEDHEEIAAGGDAQAKSLDVLEVDSSTDNEDEAVLPLVRSYASNRPIPLRYASSTIEGLLGPAAARLEPVTTIEPTKPSSTGTADESNSTDDSRNSTSLDSNTDGPRGKSENYLERGFHRSTNGEGVGLENHGVGDESSRKIISHQPWIGAIIDKSRAEEEKSSPASAGRSTHPGLDAISALVGLDQSTVNDMENMMAEARRKNNQEEQRELNSMPLFGEGKDNESRGSRTMFDLLPPELAETIFEELNSEVTWQKMHHQSGEVPRLVCCQGTLSEDGSMPVYRHPSDQTLPIQGWTPAVDRVRKVAEQAVGHPLNHALIQLYRGGTDYISEHSDKTLDIVKGSFIINVSFGAQRTMRLRTKRSVATSTSAADTKPASRITYRVAMPHNSIIMMSLPTNAEFLHGINADKRPSVELIEAEKAYNGQRISLTFRDIGTFLNEDSTRIWGQGAVGNTKDDANTVINADATESEKLVRAFGSENQSSSVDWDAIYGQGFDVLHLK